MFVDRGESARSANRPELQKMLAYITEHPDIDYVIVHKLDRLARNRADDVDINRAFEQANVRLISTTENIDQTPSGMLMHGIMSSIAEFYSRNLANEVVKGMGEKARNGGTVGRAPLGYLNRSGRDELGREARWVDPDPERAELVTDAFTLYATGKWTVNKLTEHLNARGLTSRPTPNIASAPVRPNVLLRMLQNPYYYGVVTHQGVQYPGNHQALATPETWHTVQAVIREHRNGERQRTHRHHLKTTIRCGQCGGRLIIQKTKARNGDIYEYFVCSYRQRNRGKCNFKAVLMDETEARVADIYHTIHITTEDRKIIEKYLLAELDSIYADQHNQQRQLEATKAKLEHERSRVLQAHYADAIDLPTLKEEQARIAKQLAHVNHEIQTSKADKSKVQTHLATALDLLEDCHRLYTGSPEYLQKLLNDVFFEKIIINPQDEPDTQTPTRALAPQLHEPFQTLSTSTLQAAAHAHKNAPKDKSSGANSNQFVDNVSIKTIVVALQRLDPKNLLPLIDQRSRLPATQCPSTPSTSTTRLKHTLLKESERREVIKLYLEGVSVKEICTRYQISRDTLGQLRQRMAIPERSRGLTAEQVPEVIDAYREGQSTGKLAKHYSVSPNTIAYLLRKHGVILRPRQRKQSPHQLEASGLPRN